MQCIILKHFKLQLHDDYTEKDDHYEHKPEDYIDHHHGHQSDEHSEEISVKFYCLVSETDSNKKFGKRWALVKDLIIWSRLLEFIEFLFEVRPVYDESK